jgi:hypothetical protein
MTQLMHRGVVRGGIVVLREESSRLSEGTEVVVTPIGVPAGSPASVIAAVESSPCVPAEWVDELEELIAQGHRPASNHDPFSENGDAERR